MPPPLRLDPALHPDGTGRVAVLGSIGLVAPGSAEPTPIGSPRLRRALAALVVRANSVLSVDALADVLWDQAQPANPDGALHTVMSRLRRLLAGVGLADRLQTRAPGYLLRISTADCDATVFDGLIDRADAVMDADPSSAAQELDQALELWRGRAYAEFADDDFFAPEIARLDERRAVALEHRIDAALALGRPEQAILLADAEIMTSPLRERPRAQRMLALYACGRQPDALATFREYRSLLDAELGLSPSAELSELHQRMLDQDPALDRPPRVAVITEVTHRTDAAVRMRSTGTLPVLLPTLIGRDRELAQLASLLSRDRLIVVTGSGGVGKTQLALAAASASRADFPDGNWLLELAALQDGSALPEFICTGLGIAAATGSSPQTRLLEYLAPQRVLLVIDNCEHVVDAVARLCQELMTGCPAVTVLATSQVPMDLAAERRFPLGPLPVAASTTSPAVRLFLDRVAASTSLLNAEDPDLEVIAELCRRLDGLPLAIELAAGRIHVMTPEEVLQRLPDELGLLRTRDRSATDRQRTLRNVFCWSYGLLHSAEQDVFDRLSVFRGEFSVTDAVAVTELPEAALLDLLSTLVDRSMLRTGTGRDGTVFTMLQTLRAFDAERLTQRHLDAPVREAHARRLLHLVQQGRLALNGPDPGSWVRRISDRFDDLRVAHSWALNHDVLLALELVTGLDTWIELQMTAEVVAWSRQSADAALALSDRDVTDLIVIALSMSAAGDRFGSDLRSARRTAERALDLVPDADNPIRRYPLYVLSEINLYVGLLAESTALADEVRRLARPAGDVLRDRWCLMHQALAAAYAGDDETGVGIAEELLAEPDLPAVVRAWAQYVLGEVLMSIDPQRSLVMLEAAVSAARRCEDRFLAGVAMLSHASVLVRAHRPAEATPLLSEVVEHWHRLGNRTHQWTTFRVIAEMLVVVGDDAPAAMLLGAQRHGDRAADLFGQDAERLEDLAEALTRRLGTDGLRSLMLRGGQLDHDELLALVRQALADPGALG